MLDDLLNLLSGFLDPLVEGFEIIKSAILLPVDLISYMPVILGASISIVLFVMILKFILGR